jgi:alanyl-tRNA synthetase
MENAQRAATDPTTTRFEATVTGLDGREVWLSETYFYAESGGQPADRGTIGSTGVADVRIEDGEHVHYLADDPDFESGQRIPCAIDEQYRTYCMRAHTASHLLYGAGRRLFSDLGYGGFDIGDEKVRVDFTTSTDIDDDLLVELERLTNRAVWESRPVSWESIPTEEAYERDDVAFNTKTEEGVFGDADSVRVVTVGGDDGNWDVAACGGTHVSNTREIGPVGVHSRSNPGEGLTRVEFAVGPAGIGRRADEKTALLSASAAAGVGYDELPEAVDRLQERVESLSTELETARGRLLRSRLEEMAADPTTREGHTWVVGTVPDLGPNEVREEVQSAAGDLADVVVLTGVDGRTFVAVGVGGDADADAARVVDEVTDAFGGGGGGSPTFAQGGGIAAEPDEVVDFLREMS